MVDAYVAAIQEDICNGFDTPPDDQAIDAFIDSLGRTLSVKCPGAAVVADPTGVSIYYDASTPKRPGDFAHVLVDFTCVDTQTVAIHARPDHLFKPYYVEEASGEMTLVAANGTRFEGGSPDLGDEFEDGFGNTDWHFTFPDDEARIAALVGCLAAVCAQRFERVVE